MGNEALLQVISEILMQDWDPIGVADIPEATGEYDSYARTILCLLRTGGDTSKIAGYLDQVQKVSMGLGRADSTRDRRIAERLWMLARSHQ